MELEDLLPHQRRSSESNKTMPWIRERRSVECLERGLFGVFLIVWAWVIAFLFLRSIHDPSFEHTVHLDYESFENKTSAGGPYQVYKSTIYLGGLSCGPGQNALVYYPNDKTRTSSSSQQKFPLISFAHGFRAGGNELHEVYSTLLVGLASWGFIVVAPLSGINKYCLDQYQDQLRVFDYLQTAGNQRSRLFASLDHKALYGVLGHSMGGRSSIISATKENYLIGAAAALHPAYTQVGSRVKVSLLRCRPNPSSGSDSIRNRNKGSLLSLSDPSSNV
jgi:hypothetical protein